MDEHRSEAFRVLGIPTDSDREAIAQTYRRLARACHPDVSNDPGAAERFAAVAAAYRLLSAGTGTAPVSVRVTTPAEPRNSGGTGGSGNAADRIPWFWPGTGRWAAPMVRRANVGRADSPPIVAGPPRVTPLPGHEDDRGVRDG